jgi:DNA polymerase
MLAANLKLLDIYSKVTTCEQGCTGIENKPKEGIIGRSFYCPSDVANVTILLVSKNPGTSAPRENALYAPLDGAGRVAAHTQFIHDCFAGINTLVTSQYHARIVRWVSKILDVESTPDAVFAHAAMTALVKCHSAGDKTDRLTGETVGACAGIHLFPEIETIRPRFLLALGGEAYNYLMLPAVRARHGLPVGKLYHPSWSNMRGGEARYIDEELSKLRKQYQDAL